MSKCSIYEYKGMKYIAFDKDGERITYTDASAINELPVGRFSLLFFSMNLEIDSFPNKIRISSRRDKSFIVFEVICDSLVDDATYRFITYGGWHNDETELDYEFDLLLTKMGINTN